MGQVLHGCTRTIEAVHREIQHTKESVNALSKRQFMPIPSVAMQGPKFFELS